MVALFFLEVALQPPMHCTPIRAVVTSRVGWLSTRPLFEAKTTFLPIFTNLAARPADWLAAMWSQLTELEMDGFK